MKTRQGFISNSSSSSFLIKVPAQQRSSCYNCKSYPFSADSLVNLIETSQDYDTELIMCVYQKTKENLALCIEEYKEEDCKENKESLLRKIKTLSIIEDLDNESSYIEAEISNHSRGLLSLIYLLAKTKDIEIISKEVY
jgi:hypothetical protein